MININDHLIKNAYKAIIDIVSNTPNNKTLVIDKNLKKLVTIAMRYEVSKLVDYGVTQFVYLDTEPFEPTENTIIYLVQTNYELVNILSKHMKNFPNHSHNIYFVPYRSLALENILEYNGIESKKCMFYDFIAMSLLPVDLNILSMEMPQHYFNKYIIDNDLTVPHCIAKTIQNFGSIPNICGIGPTAKYIAEILCKSRVDDKISQFDKLIIIDRQNDLITSLFSQESYRGVISELQDNEFDKIIFPTDSIYAELHNKPFIEVAQMLHEKVKFQTQTEQKVKSLQENKVNVNELKKIVEELKKVPKKSLVLHLDITKKCMNGYKEFSEYIQIENNIINKSNQQITNEFISNMIINRKSITTILRLICLQSLLGINFDLEYYKKIIILNYGFEYGFIFSDLERFGFFKTNLLNKLFDEHIQLTTMINRFILNKKIKTNMSTHDPFYFNKKLYTKTNKTLIFIVGGITFDEIDDLVNITNANIKNENNREFCIATTSIINGNKLIGSSINI